MIGIIGAMASEVEGLKTAMEQVSVTTIGVTDFYRGTLFGAQVVVAQSGIGKVNAALCTQSMIREYAPSLIINTGCAAGVGEGIRVGDIVLASSAVQHDLDYGDLGDARGFINGINVINIPTDEAHTARIAAIAEEQGIHTHIGVVATGDQFLCDPVKKADIKNHFNALAVEMEGGAIAHAAYMHGTPAVILRSVSDNGDDAANESFEQFAAKVNQKNMQILKQFLKGEQ